MKRKNSGFTLIELLAALVLAVVVGTVLARSFQAGLIAYKVNDKYLAQDREFDVLASMLTGELRNAIRFAPEPFKGDNDSIEFLTLGRRYEYDRQIEGFYKVKYEFNNGVLRRTETGVSSSLQEKQRRSDDLLTAERIGFEFMYTDQHQGIIWRRDWQNKPYVGLPRGVRIVAAMGDGAGVQTREVLLPQGVLKSIKGQMLS